jgi:hypothetical protein
MAASRIGILLLIVVFRVCGWILIVVEVAAYAFVAPIASFFVDVFLLRRLLVARGEQCVMDDPILSRLLLLVSCVPATEGLSRVASIVGTRLVASPRAISVASPSRALILLVIGILRAFLVVAVTSSAGAS